MVVEKSEGFNSYIMLSIVLDKLLAINSFFIIWIATAYVRWWFYLTFVDS